MGFRVYWGGSFRPPHLAHQKIAETLLSDPLVDHLFLVPTGQNPLKSKDSWLTSNLEEQVLSAWLNSLKGGSKLHPIWTEFKSELPSYTVQTLLSLMHDVGAEKWALALGSDLVLQLPRWRDIERLFDQIESVWVFNRVGAELDKPWEALPESLANRVSWRLMPQILPAVSSTLVRDNWKAQEALLPESVREVLGRLAT